MTALARREPQAGPTTRARAQRNGPPRSVRAALEPLAEAVTRSHAGDPRGLCAIVALVGAQTIGGSFVMGRYRHDPRDGDHAWIEHDGFLFDPTAAQYPGLATLVVRPIGDPDYVVEYRGEAALRVLVRHWPRRQKPTRANLTRLASRVAPHVVIDVEAVLAALPAHARRDLSRAARAERSRHVERH